MERDFSKLSLFKQLTSAEVLTEIVAIAIAIAISAAAAHFIRAWFRRIESGLENDSWLWKLVEGGVVTAPFFVALLVLLPLRAGLAFLGSHVGAVDLALQLVAALLFIRLGVYLFALMMGNKSWVRTWENQITIVIWLAISFELLGWFNRVESTLDAVDLIPGKGEFSLWALLKSVIVVTAFVVITSLVARAIERRVMTMQSLALSTRIGISKSAHFLLVGLGILLGVNATGVDLTALTVLTGAIGLGLGFGLQAITSNFVSGFVLLMDKSIKPGDVISFTQHTGTSTENFGWVQELRGRYVVVRDRDGVETLVPNQNLITNSVINWSYSDQRVRLRLPVMISYQDDPEVALELLIDAAREHPRILREPGPVSRLMSFENYGMRLECRFWIRDPMNGVNNVRSDVNRKIVKLFREAGIKIPVSQHEVRVNESDTMPAPQRPRLSHDPHDEHADPRR
ncbi:MAG: mechanosensitive ion channel [Steroidobacteraceae bacterium]|nr:mechanosensitive ion channel [Nevskiaceae bacterium]MCP5466134.1 mechanosensitive ion channel [Nevskiaceae bacterium]MCP5471536.1 mechanosensitive ion channel [Nevskiaceae bacterium]